MTTSHSYHVTVGGGFLRRWRVMKQVFVTMPRGRYPSYDVKYVEVARFVRCSSATRLADHLNSREG